MDRDRFKLIRGEGGGERARAPDREELVRALVDFVEWSQQYGELQVGAGYLRLADVTRSAHEILEREAMAKLCQR